MQIPCWKLAFLGTMRISNNFLVITWNEYAGNGTGKFDTEFYIGLFWNINDFFPGLPMWWTFEEIEG